MEDLILQAKMAALAFANEYLKGSDFPKGGFDEDDVRISWFSKTLQNWKATAFVGGYNDYYLELTYNGNQRELYVDAYRKIDNVTMYPDPAPPSHLENL